MHLDQRIPWNLVCSHLKVFQPPPPEEQIRFPPRLPELRARIISRGKLLIFIIWLVFWLANSRVLNDQEKKIPN